MSTDFYHNSKHPIKGFIRLSISDINYNTNHLHISQLLFLLFLFFHLKFSFSSIG